MATMNWDQPVVVLTGASSGIGKATARMFAEQGARLVLAARRKSLLHELAEECEELGGEAIAVECDVSDSSDIENLAKRAAREFGRIDIWVNNAGVGAVGRFDEIPLAEHEQLIKTNLLGVIYGCSLAMKHFREQGRGVLINVASVEGKQAIAYHASYAASKHAIVGLGSALRQEAWLNDLNDVHICTVMPASINTPFFRHAANHTGKKVSPVPPVYPPERVAETIVNLAWNPKPEVSVGGLGKLVKVQRKFAPMMTEKQMAWTQHKKQIESAEPASNSSGSLFKAMKEGTEAKDEWTETGKLVDPTALALASVVPVVGGLWLWRRISENRRGDETRRTNNVSQTDAA